MLSYLRIRAPSILDPNGLNITKLVTWQREMGGVVSWFSYYGNKSFLANHSWDLRHLRLFHILVLFTYFSWLVCGWGDQMVFNFNYSSLEAQIWTHWSIYTILGGWMVCLQWVVFASSMRWWKNVLMGFEFDVDWSVGERESCGAIRSR